MCTSAASCGAVDPRHQCRRSIHRQALARAAGVPPSDVVAVPVPLAPSGGASGGYGGHGGGISTGGSLTLLTRVTFASSCQTAAACDAAARAFAAQVDALLEAPIIENLKLQVGGSSPWPV